MILYLASDLLWASKIKGTAEALGISARPVRTLEMLEARLTEYAAPHPDPVKALVLDLEAGEIAIQMLTRAGSEQLTTVAFGPHVDVDGLARAKASGASAVMTRGAFAARLPDVLMSFAKAGNVRQDG